METAAKCLGDVVSAWRDGRAVEALDRLAELNEGPASPAVVERLRALLEPAAQQVLDALDVRLVQALENAGLSIDSTSRYPHLTIQEQLVEIDVDPRKHTAITTVRDGRKVRTAVDPATVVAAALHERAHALEYEIDSTEFLDVVAAHCDATSKAEAGIASLRSVQQRVTKDRKEIDAARFNVLMSRALANGASTTDGRQPRLSHTKDVKNGVLIWRREGGGYVGYIEFVDRAR